MRPIADIATELLLLAQPDAQTLPDQSPPRANPDSRAAAADIVAALAQIPNADLPWDEWSKIGMAVWRASSASAEGLAAWAAWSAKSAKHQEAACLERWHHWFRYPPDRIGYASLYHLARMANPLWVKPSLIAGNAIAAGRGGVASPAGDDWESGLPNPPLAARSAPAGAIAAETAPGLIATPFEPDQLAKLPPREWVYGHFLIRRFVSVLGAPGGTGKTAYAIAVGLAVALGRPLVEEPVHSTGAVWIYNLEDPREELLRRVQAALIAHGIRPTAMTGRLYLDSGRDQPLILAVRLPDGSTVATPLADALIAELIRREVRLLIVDPFVKSHRLEENRNEQVDFAATLWSRVADAAGCAVLLVHHFRKGGVAGDADAFRGASALVDAARAAVALRSMDDGEAERFGLPEEERWFYVRADNAKLNLAPRPLDATWLQLRSITLPNGDHVQAIARWRPASVFRDLSMNESADLVERLGSPRDDGERWSARKQDLGRWGGELIMAITGCSEEQARAMLAAYFASKALRIVEYPSPKQRKLRKGLDHDPQIVAGMRLNAQEGEHP
ncbi:MAG: AAA family ATPase [Roseomonas sp.]|nr:AAA family ATPase [Roseomonas sp.]MCA3653503.1 AAA family ATPase [Methylobacterium sp.]